MSSASTMRKEKKTKKEGHVRVRHEASKMESLPSELVMDILSRVPTVELGNLRCVCKRWRNIVKVRNPLFRALHMSHSMSRPTENNLLLLKGFDSLQFVDLASRRGKTIKSRRVPFFAQYDIIGSCNGLLCLGSKDRWDIVVMNPFTRQYSRLDMEFSGDVLSWGFGFDSINKIYRVVVVVWDELLEESYLRTCVLDSPPRSSDRGDIEWEDTFDYILTSESPACFVNGRLHWTHDDNGSVNIVSYDLADGQFRSVPTPDCLRNRRKFDLFVMKGCLCIIRSQPSVTPRLEIWVMKDYGVKESWVIEVDTEPHIPKSLPSHFDKNQKRRWRLTLKGLGLVRDGEVLLKCKRRESEEVVLFSSDPTCENLQFLELGKMWYQVGSVIHTASLNWIK